MLVLFKYNFDIHSNVLLDTRVYLATIIDRWCDSISFVHLEVQTNCDKNGLSAFNRLI
jgi:hypothetical protein